MTPSTRHNRARHPRALLTAFGSLGDIRPLLAIGTELAERGYRVTMASHPCMPDTVAASGLAFHPCEPDLPLDNPSEIARLVHPRLGTRALVRDLLARKVEESYTALAHAATEADILLSNELAFAAPIVAETHDIPWISTTLNPMAFFSAHDPPRFGGDGTLQTLCRLHPSLCRPLLALVKRGTRSWLNPVLKLRSELGLGTRKHPFFEGEHSPTRVLALFSPLFAQPQPDWPVQTVQTGFCFSRGQSCPSEVEAFLDQGEPPIVFTLGSAVSHAPGMFFQESIKAIEASGDRAIIIAAGSTGPAVPRHLNEQVHVTPYAPYSPLFNRAAAVVHFGGVGVSAYCLSAGKPAIVVPRAHDQFDNAAHLARIGCARILPWGRYRAARIADEIRRVRVDKPMARAAQQASERMRDEDSAAWACDEIDAVLARGSGSHARRGELCES